MPNYDYECNECKVRSVIRHAMTHEGPVACPDCGSDDTQKLILETPGFDIHWWNAKASSEATLPRYLPPARRKSDYKEVKSGK